MSFSKRILIGLSAGVAVGLFFGEVVSPLKIVADGFVKLLQMTVLPYLIISIISSLGSLTYADARRLGLRVGGVIIGLWMLALVFALAMPLAFPPTQHATFFSNTMVEHRPPFNFLDLYIPSNPFNSLANNVVPAVVLFAMFLGIALIGAPRKQQLLDVLGVASEMLSSATRFVVKLTPFGVFAICAHAAGSLSVDQLGQIQIYLITYAAIALLLAFWVLPGLVSALTPIPVRDIFASNRDALLTAFIAGDLFIVLPSLTVACEQILLRHRVAKEGEHNLPEIIVPASFNFPHSGKMLSLSFILFAGWFANVVVSVTSYPQLATSGLLTFFGGINAAVLFLLDLFRIPAETFQLFVATGVINSRFGTLLAGVHTIVLALLGSAALTGALRVRPARLLRYGVVLVLLTVGTLGGLRVLFSTVLAPKFEGAQIVYGMTFLYPHEDAVVLTGDAAANPPASDSDRVMASIRARSVLRVGFLPNRMPHVFRNAEGKLVGFAVERALSLAETLGVRAEFIELNTEDIDTDMASGLCDIVMSGVLLTPLRTMETLYSNTFMDETLAFAVRDHRREEFNNWSELRYRPGLRLATLNMPYYLSLVRRLLPLATIVPVDPDHLDFDDRANFDAYVVPAETGALHTMLHPGFTIVVPEPGTVKLPVAYPLAKHDLEWARVVNTWIELKQKDGSYDALYRHWILGQSTKAPKPRWSIMGNVLHWQIASLSEDRASESAKGVAARSGGGRR